MEETMYKLGLPVVDLIVGLMMQMDKVAHAPLPEGAAIITPNHPSTTDPVLILTLLPEHTSILIDDRLFKIPVLGDYLRKAGHIPVIPGRGREAFDEAVQRLKDGQKVAIFPEGRISPLSGGFHSPRSGAARLALLSGAPVVPVGIALDRDRIRLIETKIEDEVAVGTWYIRGPYGLTQGNPMSFNGDVNDWDYVNSVSERIMKNIIRLSGESARRLELNGMLKAGRRVRPVGLSNI